MRIWFIGIVFVILSSACTSSRWIIEETPATDTSQSVLITSEPVIQIISMPTPDNPVLRIDGQTRNVIQSPEKLQANRVIQRYRPRYGMLALGMIGAGGLLYLSAADGFFENDLSTAQKNVLRGSAGLVLGSALLNMKPIGEPRYTGEKRFLSQTGVSQRSDTTRVNPGSISLFINASYEGEVLVNRLQKVVNGPTEINLITDLGLRSFSPQEPGNISLQITTEFQQISLDIPVETVLKRYVRIASRNTPLRSTPRTGQNNIITTVAEASLLPWVETTSDGWYRVLIGITPTYVQVTDGALIWRPSVSNESDLVITTSNAAFGSIDVERNIPRTSTRNTQAIAILIGNQNYRDASAKNDHAFRSLQLMQSYLRESLGYDADRIILVEDFRTEETAEQLIGFDAAAQTLHGLPVTGLSDIFVYYAGAGAFIENQGRREAGLVPVDGLPGEGISVQSLLLALAAVPSASIQVFLDTDFRTFSAGSVSADFRAEYAQLANILTSRKRNSWVLFSSEANQFAGNYVSNDRRTDRVHGITTYYFCRAIQDGNTEPEMILRYLQRNVTFTSRRLHNRAQDPAFFGSGEQNLLRATP
jgi:hypothetical protein